MDDDSQSGEIMTAPVRSPRPPSPPPVPAATAKKAKAAPKAAPAPKEDGDPREPFYYFVHDLHTRNLPTALENALIKLVQSGSGTFTVTEADWNAPNSEVRRYFSRCGMKGLPSFVAKNLFDYLTSFGLKVRWEEDQHVVGVGHDQRISTTSFRFFDKATLPGRKKAMRNVQLKLLKQKSEIIENAIRTLESNFTQNFGTPPRGWHVQLALSRAHLTGQEL